jgi:hypothetical protein
VNVAGAVVADPGEEDIVVSPDLAHVQMLPPEVTLAKPDDLAPGRPPYG